MEKTARLLLLDQRLLPRTEKYVVLRRRARHRRARFAT
jgi:methylthioribose-1-phosphate isomerase